MLNRLGVRPSDVRAVTNDIRRGSLREALEAKTCLRVIEAHSPLSALIAQSAAVEESGDVIEFDAFWSSSLTDSTLRGKPDIEILDLHSRMGNIRDIFEVTSKPMIVDGDTGGQTEHFALNVRSLELLGVSAVIIEDKTGLKKNSLLGTDVEQHQESIPSFCEKIAQGKRAKLTGDLMIFARVESLILRAGMEDAVGRAFAYVDAGADGILIHSRQSDPGEIFEFSRRFRERYPTTWLACVPTSYAHVRFADLAANGFNVVIYANHLLRASYPAMRSVALDILANGRTLEAEPRCLSITEILDLIPGTR